MNLSRNVCSEFYRLKRSPVLWLHLLRPLAGAFAFLIYYSASGTVLDKLGRIDGYLECLCGLYPFLIGVVCGMSAAQEEQAGDFQVLLCAKSRAAAFLGKLICLFLLSAGSVALAVGVFAAGFHSGTAKLYGEAAVVLLLGNLFCYALSLCAALRFGRGASIGLGVAAL